ncbi:hypothetical protein [Streptomyces adelaidensis]|uniref:hypothetical protein n=1 Tax=Streptomyces adelaidensis TaxID=2796465 RepID=UPI001907E96A|nr:hypothetical protein [Streptomyces adelaidensis]
MAGAHTFTSYETGCRYGITVLSGSLTEVPGSQALGGGDRGLTITADTGESGKRPSRNWTAHDRPYVSSGDARPGRAGRGARLRRLQGRGGRTSLPFDHQDESALPDSVTHSEVLYPFVEPPLHGRPWAARTDGSRAAPPTSVFPDDSSFKAVSPWA